MVNIENANKTRIKTGAIRKILIVTSVLAEKEHIMKGLRGDPRFDVLVAGVGSTIVAANTASVLANSEYQLVINMGIGGGFADKAEICSVVVASEVIAADLGAETQVGFMNLEELQLGITRVVTDSEISQLIIKGIEAANIPVLFGPVLTISTVTGTKETAAVLANRVPGALAEAMEGYGVAIAAQLKQLPVVEIRSISNAIGPRERENWKIAEALTKLEQVSLVLSEVL